MGEAETKVETPAADLLPCPFCGVTGQLHEDDAVNVFHATCGNDECLMFPGVYAEESAAEAIRKWNTRTDSELLKERDQLRAAAQNALEWFAGFPHQGTASHFDKKTADDVFNDLESALTPKPSTEAGESS